MALCAHQIHKIYQLIEKFLGRTDKCRWYLKVSEKDLEVTLICE